MFLTHTVNFGIRSVFSKRPASAFSEGPGPGLVPLYKVCPFKATTKTNNNSIDEIRAQ